MKNRPMKTSWNEALDEPRLNHIPAREDARPTNPRS